MSLSRCLIIGGAGFIGSHLVRRLIASGRHISILDKCLPESPACSEVVSYVIGDFADRDLLARLVADHDEIIHLAYSTVPNTSFDDPLADLTQNLPPTVHLFELAARSGAKLILGSSGGTVYGEAVHVPQPEDHPTRPISPYGVTKLTLEKYAYLYTVTHGLKVICVRPANPYGEGQRPFIGQGFIATAMASALKGRAVNIFGESGSVRDYIHIDDLIGGLTTVLDRGVVGETYNIGTSVGHSNLQILQAMHPLLQELGCHIQIEHMPARPFDVHINVLDCTKLRKLGWKPTVNLDDGLRRTRDWLLDVTR